MTRIPITAAQARKVLAAYEAGVYVPVTAWLREGRVPEAGDEYFRADLRSALDDLHAALKAIVQDREQS